MSGIAIGTFVKLLDENGADTGFNFQNFFQGEDRVYNGDTYTFGGFGFSGGTLDLEGGNISASLVFSVGELSLSIFRQAAEILLAKSFMPLQALAMTQVDYQYV
jgi:hypothetical protein